MSISSTELHWLAGILEGEGSFYVGKTPNGAPRIRIQCIMTDEDIIRRMHQITGIGNVTFKKQNNPKWADTWCWSVTYSEDVATLAQTLKPLMGQRRNLQIDKLLKTHETMSGNRGFLGRKHTEATKRKMRLAHARRKAQ